MEYGEIEEYRAFRKLDRECKAAIEETIRQNFDGTVWFRAHGEYSIHPSPPIFVSDPPVRKKDPFSDRYTK